MSIDCYKYIVPTGRRLGRFVAIAIALSFFATLLPIAGASADKSNMPCCAGKAGHCESGLIARKPLPPKEPMCGLHTDTVEDDGITIVAEPSHTETRKVSDSSATQPAAQSASVNQPCHMDCGACLAGSRPQQRDRGIAPAETCYVSRLTIVLRSENLPRSSSSNNEWAPISPRGPPTSSI